MWSELGKCELLGGLDKALGVSVWLRTNYVAQKVTLGGGFSVLLGSEKEF